MESEQGKCISQLREVFDSCDESNSGYLGRCGILSLCSHLQLADQADLLLQKLLRGNNNAEVDFEEFKEGFISLLTQSACKDEEYESESEENDFENDMRSASEREVSPKFVLGAKKYGRRSRPASLIENDCAMSIDCQESEVFAPNESNDETQIFVKNRSESVKKYLETCSSTSSSPEHLPLVLSRPPSCASQLDQEGIQWNSPEEFLRALWKRLEVGKDGYLNRDELACVCNSIGMEATHETIGQLFDKLDSNNDGNVSFEELLQGLFQHEGPDLTMKAEMSFTCSPVNHRIYKGNSQEEMQICEPVTESSIFTSIDLDNEGYVTVTSIADMWESLGISNGIQILQDLGFNIKLKINLQDLTLLLEEELASACSDPVYQVALITLQHELRCIRISLAQIKTERDKLKGGVLEANNRAALLAQEIDDHHTKLEENSQQQMHSLEKKYQDQLRDVQEELRKERDTLTTQIANLKQELEEQIEDMQDLEANFKRQLSLNETENNRLELELQDFVAKYNEIENRNGILQKELDSASEVRQKFAELESARGLKDYSEGMNKDLEDLRKENKDLQDHADELLLEIEHLKQLLSSTGRSNPKRHNRINSWLADYNKGLGDLTSGSGLKRRGSASSSDGNSEDENRMVGKIRRRLSLSPGKEENNMMESYEPDDDQGLTIDVKPYLTKDSIFLSSSSSSLQKYTESAMNPFEEITKQLHDDLHLKSQIISEKDAIIVQLKQDFQNLLSEKDAKMDIQMEKKEKLHDEQKAEIVITIKDLQRLVKSMLQSTNGPQSWVEKSIEERFQKIQNMIDPSPSSEKQEQSFEFCLSEPKLRRGVVSGSEPSPSLTDKLLKDLYVENARLTRELQLAEQQQRRVEQSNGRLQYKCKILSKLLADVTIFTTKQQSPI